jgi:hypothetical protein
VGFDHVLAPPPWVLHSTLGRCPRKRFCECAGSAPPSFPTPSPPCCLSSMTGTVTRRGSMSFVHTSRGIYRSSLAHRWPSLRFSKSCSSSAPFTRAIRTYSTNSPPNRRTSRWQRSTLLSPTLNSWTTLSLLARMAKRPPPPPFPALWLQQRLSPTVRVRSLAPPGNGWRHGTLLASCLVGVALFVGVLLRLLSLQREASSSQVPHACRVESQTD